MSRDYGKVHTSFWTSETIRALSESARTLAFYLLTSPHTTIAGVFRLPDGYVCDDLQWSAERVAEGFAELLSNGFANRCETTKWVWICKHLEWNPPENPNQRKSASKCAESVPDQCTWKPYFLRTWGEFLGLSAPPRSNCSETVPQPLLNQKQEQKQEQKKEMSPLGSRLPADWELPADWRDWAKAERTDLDIRTEAASFADYWHAKPGKDGRKTDWQATWRNWIRRANGSPPGRRPQAANLSPAAQRRL